MPMATYMAIGLLGLGICRGMGSPGEQDSSRKRPNIIVIMADDMGYSDIGCYGSEISTPNLDRLASRGLRFTQFYNMARCCPTRASLLTGLHPHQAGIGHMTEDLGHPSYQGDLNRQCVTIAEALRPAGYRTLVAGKWHVTPGYKIESRHNWPLQRGFDRYYGEMIGAGSYYDPPILVRDNTVVKTREKDYFYTDAITSASLNYIEEFGNKQEPFFLYTAYTAPHSPGRQGRFSPGAGSPEDHLRPWGHGRYSWRGLPQRPAFAFPLHGYLAHLRARQAGHRGMVGPGHPRNRPQ